MVGRLTKKVVGRYDITECMLRVECIKECTTEWEKRIESTKMKIEKEKESLLVLIERIVECQFGSK